MTSDYKPNYWEKCVGWFDWMNLYDEVAMTTPAGSCVVEVGVAFGRSLLYLAQRIRETGKDIQIYAVDRWQPYGEHAFIYGSEAPVVASERAAYESAKAHGGVYGAFLHNLYESGLAEGVSVIRADSVAAVQLWHGRVGPHFVFIDAEHEYTAVRADLDAWWATGPEWMAGHDFNPKSEIHFPGVWKAVYKKWPEQEIEWKGQTCFVARRATLERRR